MTKIPHLERTWHVPENLEIPDDFRQHLDAPDIVLQTLVKRGLMDHSAAVKFLDYRQFTPTSPLELPDLENGVNRIVKAIDTGEMIGVWGDFDVDGQTATSILVSSLRHLGANVKFHIPVRAVESHGINLESLKNFISTGIKVLLTCDTGISANESISYAQSIGIDCIVTDHHMLPVDLPPAFALVNPRRLPLGHPLGSLPGVGTAYKFAEHLLSRFGKKDFSNTLHDLVALGSIADLAELTGDTRYLVQSGLDSIRSAPRPALQGMLRAAEIVMENFNEEQVSFSLAPRLNAIGRLGDANPMVDFLLSDNSVDIAVMVNQLEGMNARRKILCDQVFNGALALIEKDRSLLDQPVLILDHPDWPAGVVGIVASRLIEMFQRPVILLVSPPGQPIKGSARSIEGIDISAILTQNQKYLLSFGGHPMAAGLSLSAENYLAFKRSLSRTVALQTTTNLPTIDLMIDNWLIPSAFSLNLLKSIDSLSPFGPGNPPLLFASDSMLMVDSTPVGKMKEHLQLIVEDRTGNQTQLIWWHGNGLPLPDGRFDLAYTAHSSNYRGEKQVQFEWVDFRQTVESISVKSRSHKKEITHHDHRQAIQPLKDLEGIQVNPDHIVWSEGTCSLPVPGFDHLLLHPAATLILWSTPPDIETLRAVVKAVNPDEIHWFINSPREHELGFYLKSISRKVKDLIRNGQNEINCPQIAVQQAVTIGIVKLAFEWLACEGNITLYSISDDLADIALGGRVDVGRKHSIEKALVQAFNELHSFESYLKRVDIHTLGQQLG